MAADVEDLSIDFEEDGVLVVKQLDKVILSKGAWATIIFKYVQWEKKNEDYGPCRFTIRRYRKMNGEFRQQAKFNISSTDQANKISEALRDWANEGIQPTQE